MNTLNLPKRFFPKITFYYLHNIKLRWWVPSFGRYWGGNILLFGLGNIHLELDFRKNWLNDMTAQERRRRANNG